MSRALLCAFGAAALAAALAGCAESAASPAPSPTPAAPSLQQWLADGVRHLRTANTGAVTATTERVAVGAVRTSTYVGLYDLNASRWSLDSTVTVLGERAGGKRAVKLRYVGTDTVAYSELSAGPRRWLPLELDRSPGSGSAGVALVDALEATRVVQVRTLNGERILLGEVPTPFAVQMLGMVPDLLVEGVRPELLRGFAPIEIVLDQAGRPAKVAVLGSTLQSLDLPEPLLRLARTTQYTATFANLGTAKAPAPLPRDADVLVDEREEATRA
ncbi:MAG: hypothetical protein ACT4QG_21660 [Sporichthyaceae bacterium]